MNTNQPITYSLKNDLKVQAGKFAVTHKFSTKKLINDLSEDSGLAIARMVTLTPDHSRILEESNKEVHETCPQTSEGPLSEC